VVVNEPRVNLTVARASVRLSGSPICSLALSGRWDAFTAGVAYLSSLSSSGDVDELGLPLAAPDLLGWRWVTCSSSPQAYGRDDPKA